MVTAEWWPHIPSYHLERDRENELFIEVETGFM